MVIVLTNGIPSLDARAISQHDIARRTHTTITRKHMNVDVLISLATLAVDALTLLAGLWYCANKKNTDHQSPYKAVIDSVHDKWFVTISCCVSAES